MEDFKYILALILVLIAMYGLGYCKGYTKGMECQKELYNQYFVKE